MQNSSSISIFSSVVKTNALIAAVLVVGMLGVFLATGIGQDPLQYVHSLSDYQNILTHNSHVLKFTIGLDNAFILFYLSMFMALALTMSKLNRLDILGKMAMILIFVTAILDILENMHFLTMISSALEGFMVSEDEMKIQVWESMVKFHVSYIGFYLLSFGFSGPDIKERILCFLLRWVQWPVGMLIYIAPIEVAQPLVLVRFAFFFTSLTLLASIKLARTKDVSG